MRIAVDVDGVLYEWDRTARYMLRTYRDTVVGESLTWDYIEQHVPRSDWGWLWTDGVDLGLFRYGHCVAGSIVGLRNLLADGHSLAVVTHRPSSAVPDTLAWLNYINIQWSEVHILSNGESKAQVDADILIDDKMENVIEWAASGRKALLFDRPWNQQIEATRIERCYDWRDVVNSVKRQSIRDTGFAVVGVGAGGDNSPLRRDVEGRVEGWREKAFYGTESTMAGRPDA